MIKKLLKFINQPTLFGEIMRFVLVGGLATVIDFLAMGITLYAFDPSLYPHFYNVFFGGGKPSALSANIGTGVGFLVGLLANYLLSILFVFNEKGKSKTATGFIKFTIFSAIGLGIHELGMFLMYNKMYLDLGLIKNISENAWVWIIKIILTGVVLVYNYITRRLFIFKKENNTDSLNNTTIDDNNNIDKGKQNEEN